MSKKSTSPLGTQIFTTGQIAKLCKVAPRTATRWVDSGRLKGYRIPGSLDRRIPVASLKAFLVEYGFPQEIIDQVEVTEHHAITLGLPKEFADSLAAKLGADWTVRQAQSTFELGQFTLLRRPTVVVLGPLVPQSEALAVAQQLRRVSDRMRLVVLVPEDVGEVEPYREAGFEVVLPWTGDVEVVVGEVVK